MKPKSILCLLIVLVLLTGCSAWENSYEQAAGASFKVISISGPSGISFLKAMHAEIKPGVRLGDSVYYEFENDEEALYNRLIQGEFDIALVPTETAAKLYNNGAGYQLAAVITGGWMPELLSEGIVNDYVVEVQDEWMRVNEAEPFPYVSLIVRNDMNDQELEAWDLFLADYQDSINWINNNKDKAEELLQEHEMGIPAELAQEVLQRIDLQYIDALNAREAVDEYLNMFFELSPESIGGKLPDSGFYTK